jgi:hypothetical protein
MKVDGVAVDTISKLRKMRTFPILLQLSEPILKRKIRIFLSERPPDYAFCELFIRLSTPSFSSPKISANSIVDRSPEI